ncbi:MAG: hypothetical protein ACI9LX_000021 [Paraglaciecola sp.]|jgi:hypothetical protein
MYNDVVKENDEIILPMILKTYCLLPLANTPNVINN